MISTLLADVRDLVALAAFLAALFLLADAIGAGGLV